MDVEQLRHEALAVSGDLMRVGRSEVALSLGKAYAAASDAVEATSGEGAFACAMIMSTLLAGLDEVAQAVLLTAIGNVAIQIAAKTIDAPAATPEPPDGAPHDAIAAGAESA